MYNITLELGNINKSLSLSFGVIVNTPNDLLPNFGYQQTISAYEYGGKNYIKIKPSSYMLLKIKEEKNEGWSINNSISLNPKARFDFLFFMRKFLMSFRDPDLFYYTDNHTKLVVNPECRQKYSFVLFNGSNKSLRMEPAVISPNNENEDIFYEGAILYINGYDNFVYLTYAEAEYLYNEIKETNMKLLSLMLLKFVPQAQISGNYEEVKVTKNDLDNEETKDSGSLVTIKKTENIPDI